MHEKFENARWFLGLGIAATEGEIMTEMEKFLNQLREAIGAKEDTDQAGVLSALKAQRDSASEFRVAVCKAVDLDPAKTEKAEDIIAAVNSAKVPAKPATNGDVVPKAQYEALANNHKELSEQVSTLANRVNSGDAEERIKAACEKGLLTEHMLEPNKEGKNHFRDLANKPDEWAAWLEIAPAVAPKSGRVVANSAKPAGPGGERGQIIATAKAEFADNESRIACSRTEYVNECLRENDKDQLTESETQTLVA